MNLKKNYASVSGATDLKSTLLDKSKGIRNFNMYMKKGAFDKTNISKNIKSFSINEKINYNKILTENTNKYKPLETRNEISKNSPSDTSFSNNKIDIKISVNYLKNNSNLKELGKKIIYLVKTEDNNKGSLSNILMQDLQSKENMLKNMKSSMSEDKIRKKIFSNEKDLNITNIAKNEVKPIHKRNPTSNQDIIQNNLNISLLTYENRPRIQNIYNNTTTNKMHLTTNNTVISNNPSISGNFMNTQQNMNNSNVLLGNSYTLNNIYNRDKINDSSFLHQTHQDQTVNSSSNLFKDTSITYANSSNNILKDNNKIITLDKEYLLKIANLEKKFDEIHIFSSSTSNNNITIIAQKYRAYKKIFDEYNNVSTSNESSGLTTKIANGYNDIVKNILNQYSSVLEKLTINNNDNKKLNEANSEILRLRTKLNEVELKKTKPKQSNLAIENNIKFNIKSSANLAVKNNPINKINNDINSIKLSSNIVENNNYINIPDNKNNNTNIPNNVTNSNSVINKSFILPIENSEHNKIISAYNITMIDDLEALYFSDKVHMRSNSATINKIPKLNFNVVEEKINNNKEQNNNANVDTNQINKNDEAKKQLKDYKLKVVENTNKPIQNINIYNNNKQLNHAEDNKTNENLSFLNKINNFTTKNNQTNLITYSTYSQHK